MNDIIDAGRAAIYAFQMVRHGSIKALAASMVPVWESNRAQEPSVDFQSLAIVGYSRNPVVYSCIQALARSSAEAPAKVMQRLPNGVWEEDFNHPLRQLLQFPNQFESGFELVEDIITHLFIAGNAYLEKERARGGEVVGLHPLMPDRVRVVPGSTFIKGYEYTIGDQTVFLPRDDVIHFRLPNPLNRYYGLAPLAVLARVVDADNATIDWIRLFFVNSAVPMGVLKTKHRVDEIEAERIKARWKEKFVNNWHDVSVLDSDADYIKIGVGLDDLDVGNLTNTTESRICTVFGVPPILVGVKVGLERATFSNAREAKRSFWDETLIPLYKRLEMRLNLSLAEDFNLSASNMVRHDLSMVRALQEDEDQLWLRAARGLRAGGITINDFRRMVNLPTTDVGDVYLFPANTIPVDMDGNPIFVQSVPSGTTGTEGQMSDEGDENLDSEMREMLDSTLFPGETWEPLLNGSQP